MRFMQVAWSSIFFEGRATSQLVRFEENPKAKPLTGKGFRDMRKSQTVVFWVFEVLF